MSTVPNVPSSGLGLSLRRGEAGFGRFSALVWAAVPLALVGLVIAVAARLGLFEPPSPPAEAWPLWSAALHGDLEGVEAALQAGVAPDTGEARALVLAAAGGFTAVAERLLAAGANPEGMAFGGRTPLIAAAAAGEVEIVDRLLEAGAAPHQLGRWLRSEVSPLAVAVEHDQGAVVRVFAEYGVDPDREVGARMGWPLLVEAAMEARADAVEALLAAGADPRAADPSGVTALSWAASPPCHDQRPRVVRALLAAGAPRETGAEGGSPRDQAALLVEGCPESGGEVLAALEAGL